MGECWHGWIWTLHVEWLWARKRNVGWDKGSLVYANGMIILGKVRFAPDMHTQHSQKGDNDSLWSEVVKSFPPIGYACARLLLGTCALLSSPLMSLSLSKDCPPCSGKVTFHSTILTLTWSFSLLQPLHNILAVLGFKWGNHNVTLVLYPTIFLGL